MIYATIFAALYHQLMLYRTQKKKDQYLQLQKEQMELQLEKQETIKRMKHDLKTHLTTLYGLLAENHTEEARVYLSQLGLGEYQTATETRDYCYNPYINGILNQFAFRFKKQNASLKMDLQIGEIPVPYMELSLVLSNALENALDALVSLPIEKRNASLQLRCKKNYLLLRVKNSCATDLRVEKGTLPPTRKNSPGHGYGLVTIRDTSSGLGGHMTCYTEKGQFILDVMLKIKAATAPNE